jgi:hypothetical protein
MSDHTSVTTPSRRPPYAAVLAVPLLTAVVLLLFAWPASRLEPRHLPVGVAGPPQAARAIEQRLDARSGAFDIHRYADEAAARTAIEDRDIYGALVATPSRSEILVATGASATVAQMIVQAAGEQSGPGAPRVRDVVPAAKHDPRGTGLSSAVLPLVLAGILAGLVATFLSRSLPARAALVTVASVLTGLAAVAIAQPWLGVLEHNWLASWGVFSLVVLSIGSVVTGFEALLGPAGAALGSLTMMIVGNPFSAVSSAPEMLPTPVGAIGQFLPPGAGGNLLRSTAFFDGAAAGAHAAVLAAWVLTGMLALAAAAVLRRDVVVTVPQPVTVP